MSSIKNQARLADAEAEINRAQIEHRATWMGLIYDEAVKSGAPNAEEITRSAIRRCGGIHGQNFKKQLKDPEDMEEFSRRFLNDVARKTFEQDVQADYDRVDVVFHYCPLVSAWKKLDFDDEVIVKLCDMAMDGDRGIAEQMGVDFDLRCTIAEGDDCCHLCLTKKKKA